MKRKSKKSILSAYIKSGLFIAICFSAIWPASAQSELPAVTVRFGNPSLDFETKKYTIDVEFQSNTEGIRLFGMNVRFFYEKDVIDFISFINFAPGYEPVNPNPPMKRSLAQESGSLFGFQNNAVFVNGAVQLTNPNAQPVYLVPGQWTKVFGMSFVVVSNPDFITGNEFKPQIIWDLEENPLHGGFMPGSEGVVITVIRNHSSITAMPCIENALHHNWVNN